MASCSDENGWCGYCGNCREQYQHEVDTMDDSCYDSKDDNDTPDVIYWRI